MDTITPAGTALRHRMTEDMRMRRLEPRTQEAYIRAVRKLTVFLKRPPDTTTVEDLRNFQLQLVDTGTSPVTLNATPTGLKFFFDITLGRIDLMARMQPVKRCWRACAPGGALAAPRAGCCPAGCSRA